MELLDRYLNFIRILLPRAKQQDIIAELSEDLRAQIADQEAELGRSLKEEEIEALLQRCGHPLLVAARYQSQQSLIGQPFYPLYIFALKLVQRVLFPMLLVVGAFVALFREHPIPGLIGSVGDAIASAFYMVGLITVVFIVLERLQTKLTFFDNWKPSELPKMPVVPDQTQIPRSSSIGGFIGLAAFLVWWIGLVPLPSIPNLAFINPLPATFYWPVLLLFGAEMVMHLVNLFLPWWTRRRAAVRVVLDVAGLALALVLLYQWPWFALKIGGLTAGAQAKLELVMNGALYVSTLIMTLSYAFRILQDLRRALGKPPFMNPLLVWFGYDGTHSRN